MCVFVKQAKPLAKKKTLKLQKQINKPGKYELFSAQQRISSARKHWRIYSTSATSRLQPVSLMVRPSVKQRVEPDHFTVWCTHQS
jgi:hypothetical protein